MTTLEGPSPPHAQLRSDEGRLHEVPARADGVQLIGEMRGSGYRVPPALVRRADGQTLQLSPLLYLVLEGIDGRRDATEVAAVVSSRYGRRVSPENVLTLIDEKLRPLGLLLRADGAPPQTRRTDPLLGLRLRRVITDPDLTRRITAPFARLFHPLVVVFVLGAFALVSWWVLFHKGLASAAYEAFQHPGLLLLVFVVTLLSAGFHEFGHAAAARRGGATPGAMGFAFYLVWPAFYTDVTDSYRLGKGGRLRTDLGGLYFNAVVAVLIAGAWLLTSYDALLLVVATQLLQMVRQLTPLVRFDGYHVLADVTGVPDLFHRIKPTLLGVLPWRWGDPEGRLLKPWVRVVVTLWVVVVVPVLLVTLALMAMALPRLLATAWAALEQHSGALGNAWHEGDLMSAAARGLSVVAVALPVLAVLYLLVRLGYRLAAWAWRWSKGSSARRSVASLGACALALALAWAWWPDGRTYRPIEPTERGTLVDALTTSASPGHPAPASTETTEVGGGSTGVVTAVWDTQQPLPTKADPQLALVLVPHGAPDSQAKGWVFPFDHPLAPEPGDNQALAINTEDGTVTYDVTVALVWVEDGDAVLNTNEAYAFASCTGCAAVAVAFQVVIVLGDSDTVVPQNLAGAVSYDCVNCLTYALAQQLLVTVDEPLSPTAMAELDALWQQIAEFADVIESVPLSEIDDRLDEFAEQILTIIETDQPGTLPSPTDSGPPTAGTTPAPSPSPTASETPTQPTTSSTPSDSPTTSEPTPTSSLPSPTASTSPTDPSGTP
ncbi:MAG TPA: hypothetical protein VFK52_09190 [Nocardioidaceae bacterium]|nr:hypothetical protein [Nocardioidaceae bacterium]